MQASGLDLKSLEIIREDRLSIVYRVNRIKGLSIAFKKLKGIGSGSQESLHRECEILKKFDSLRIVRTYGIEEFDSSLVLILESYEGVFLNEFITDKTLDIKQKFKIAIDLTLSVWEIHNSNVIHKDINPKNVVIKKDLSDLKIIDFGKATFLQRETQEMVKPEQIDVDISYISPEQTGRLNKAMDYRTDIYSLGVVLYEIFTNQLPFKSDNPSELVHLHIAGQPTPPIEINPTLPLPLSNIILKCLSKDPEDRYHSAYGLQIDLKECLKELNQSGIVQDFTIGQKDIYNHFQIPQKLYGREEELALLKDTFNQVVDNASLVVMLKGVAGMGKSSLVYELQKEITVNRGYFTSGKCEQYKKNIPYYALIQAVQNLLQQILSEDDRSLEDWKNKILEAVGPNGQVIVEVVPDIKHIIGEQPPVAKLTPQPSENRFNFVFSSFIKVFLSKGHPLVIFLDDLQWVDDSTLKLLQFILNDSNLKNLMLIGAFRDKEVSPLHTLHSFLEDIKKSGVTLQTIEIKPLSLEAILALIKDSLHSSERDALKLAHIVFPKTRGNPFFVTHFIKMLYQKRFISFDLVNKSWKIDYDSIEKVEVTENVADLMIQKIKELNPVTQTLLQTGAVIGRSFDLDLLSSVHGMSTQEVANYLQEALHEELIIRKKNQAPEQDKTGIYFIFQHDKILQAAYDMIPVDRQYRIHDEIGQVMLSEAHQRNNWDNVIDIVTHLNQASNIYRSDEDKDELAQLNLQAGIKTKDSIAFDAAERFMQEGINCLRRDCWESQRELTFSLYEDLAICKQLTGHEEEAKDIFKLMFSKALNREEKIRIYVLMIVLDGQTNNHREAVEKGIEALKLYGYKIKTQPTKFDLYLSLMRIKIRMFFKKNIKKMHGVSSDHEYETVASVYSALLYSAYFTGNNNFTFSLVCKLVNITLSHGINIYSPMAFETLATIYSSDSVKDYKGCAALTKLGLELTTRYPHTRESIEAQYTAYFFCLRWEKNIRDLVQPLKVTSRQAFEVGHVSYAVSSLVSAAMYMLTSGENLNKLLKDIDQILNEVRKYKTDTLNLVIEIYRQVCMCLLGENEDPAHIVLDKHINDYFKDIDKSKTLFFKFKYDLWNVIIQYLFGHYPEALENCDTILRVKNYFINLHEWNVFYFYYGLTLVQVLTKKRNDTYHWKELYRVIGLFEDWAEASPKNYAHQYHLILAEFHRLNGDQARAIENYEKARSKSKENGFINDRALTNELTAYFYQSINLSTMQTFYLQQACRLYNEWGAYAKVKQLIQKFPELEELRTLSNGFSNFNVGNIGLDLNAVFEASQTISKEIVLENLVSALMKLVIVQAGADKAFLILPEGDKLVVYARMMLNQKTPRLIDAISVDQFQNELSVAVVKYVARKKSELLLNDVKQDSSFTRDPYILANNPRSILCIPLIQQGNITGIIYLENTLGKGVFTPSRIKILSLLSSQMAISIQNAMFYNQLETKVNERTQQLQEKNVELKTALHMVKQVQTQLIQQEKLASIGLLSSGIAHELKNPLNFIINFSQLSGDLTKELQEAINKGDKNEIDEVINQLNQAYSKIDFHGKRADEIIKGMLLHAHSGSGKRELANIPALLDQSFNLVYHSFRQRDVNFNLSIDKKFDTVPRIAVYPGDLIRAFINIIDNSCYALLEKVRSEPGFSPQLTLMVENKPETLNIVIRDNGNGIPKEDLDKIFQPFFTTKPVGVGTGLGLSIVYETITKLHQGSISADSKVNEFTQFTIQLPKVIEIGEG
jgi:predicted ATPase/signal transduction histidine kinase